MSRPDRYGLVHLRPSYNPLRARSLREVLGYLFMWPGWAPDGRSTTTEALRAQQRALGATASPAVAASGTSSGALGAG